MDPGLCLTRESASGGSYKILLVPFGEWRLEVEGDGFQRPTRSGVRHAVGGAGAFGTAPWNPPRGPGGASIFGFMKVRFNRPFATRNPPARFSRIASVVDPRIVQFGLKVAFSLRPATGVTAPASKFSETHAGSL